MDTSRSSPKVEVGQADSQYVAQFDAFAKTYRTANAPRLADGLPNPGSVNRIRQALDTECDPRELAGLLFSLIEPGLNMAPLPSLAKGASVKNAVFTPEDVEKSRARVENLLSAILVPFIWLRECQGVRIDGRVLKDSVRSWIHTGEIPVGLRTAPHGDWLELTEMIHAASRRIGVDPEAVRYTGLALLPFALEPIVCLEEQGWHGATAAAGMEARDSRER
ncbi:MULTISPECIES: hypothetical protein [unclassified Burkholderia]|uniref:hypothetical protein n=1 Tax=unclassified Burkholderia TaxID=2613784 RepID=UPI002AB2C9A3|nr:MULTISPECIES: hypothetical protein [unclassified Burkholderia]